jgi:hypothetical protein
MRAPSKSKSESSTPFSEFIREAPSREKKRVYGRVLEKATKEQKDLMKKASSG